MKHRRWRFELPSNWEDPLSGDLWSCGCTGVQLSSTSVPDFRGDLAMPAPDEKIYLEAWLPDPLPEAASAFDFAAWEARGVRLVGSEIIAEQDWLAAYRESVEPFDVGRRFRVDPRDVDSSQSEEPELDGRRDLAGRILLRIPAQTAFGTGSHESTRLMIVLLEALPLTGLRVLDVGTGSGILALVCRHLGASKMVGFDLDPASPLVARQNALLDTARRSSADPSSCAFFVGTAAALAASARFDLLLVNVLPERIAQDLPRLVSCLEPGGFLVSSGNLLDRRNELLERLTVLGLRVVDEAADGEWVAFVLEKCQLSS